MMVAMFIIVIIVGLQRGALVARWLPPPWQLCHHVATVPPSPSNNGAAPKRWWRQSKLAIPSSVKIRKPCTHYSVMCM